MALLATPVSQICIDSKLYDKWTPCHLKHRPERALAEEEGKEKAAYGVAGCPKVLHETTPFCNRVLLGFPDSHCGASFLAGTRAFHFGDWSSSAPYLHLHPRRCPCGLLLHHHAARCDEGAKLEKMGASSTECFQRGESRRYIVASTLQSVLSFSSSLTFFLNDCLIVDRYYEEYNVHSEVHVPEVPFLLWMLQPQRARCVGGKLLLD